MRLVTHAQPKVDASSKLIVPSGIFHANSAAAFTYCANAPRSVKVPPCVNPATLSPTPSEETLAPALTTMPAQSTPQIVSGFPILSMSVVYQHQ